jgi:solute carrier family 36 (proton-coupled amino acid transporter)
MKTLGNHPKRLQVGAICHALHLRRCHPRLRHPILQIMFPTLQANFKIINQYPLPSEMIFRVLMVLVTFAVAFLVPNLGLLISLIGAICSTSLALVFPVMIELLVITRNDESPAPAVLIKDFLILLLAIIGFFSGGYESLRLIVKLY